jgi:hypothetical protein
MFAYCFGIATGGLGLAKRRSRLGAIREALAGLAEVLHDASGRLGEVDAVGLMADAARVAVTVEALVRGEVPGGASGRVGVAP